MAKLYELETKIKEADERIVEIEGVEYGESATTVTLINSHGLKLVQRTNDFQYVAAAVAKQGEQVKTGYDYYFGNDFSKFDVDELVKKVVKTTVEKLGGEPCKSKTYKAVLSQDVVSSLLRAYIGNANSESVQKNSSLFIGKLNQQIASKKLTVEDTPINKTIFARSFDDEGVATYNKAIIKNGVLQTYLYNLTTAAKEGVTTTGNGVGAGKPGIRPFYLRVKPGKLSLEEMFAKVNNGIYITDVAGLHAGLNPQSGNFSLQASGFLIENGKKTTPVDLITIGGNLLEVFSDVKIVGGDTQELIGMSTPSLYIKKIKVSGK
jgi:PmbA protein